MNYANNINEYYSKMHSIQEEAARLNNIGIALLKEGKDSEALTPFRCALAIIRDFISQENRRSPVIPNSKISECDEYMEKSSPSNKYNLFIVSGEKSDSDVVAEEKISCIRAIRSCISLQPTSIRYGGLESKEDKITSFIPYENAFHVKILYETSFKKDHCELDLVLLGGIISYNMALSVQKLCYGATSAAILTKCMGLYKVSLSLILEYIEESSYKLSDLQNDDENSEFDEATTVLLMAAFNNIGYVSSLMSCNKSMLSCLDSLKAAVSHSNQISDNYALFDAYEFIIFYINCMSTHHVAGAA